MINGPTRIILIDSGKYQYAEVDIDKAIHLVGPNNSGKTTLIATLQYLYVDNERALRFSKDYNQTKRYYFKSEYSYILFECMTPNGYMVVGVRGTSALGNGSHERFVYKGSYYREDYFDENNFVKKGDLVKLALSEKEYRCLAPAQLRAALTGAETGTGIILDLLPIKNREGYNNFRNLYHNLLELSNIGQKELKNALIHISLSELRTNGEIDLIDSYSQGYERIRKSLHNIKSIKKIERFILECLSSYEEREESRADLVYGYTKILELFSEYQAKNISTIETLDDELDQCKGEIEQERQECKRQDQRIEKLNMQIGAAESEVKRLTTEQEKFKDYLPKFEKTEIDGLARELNDVEFKLQSIDVEPFKVIKTRLQKNKLIQSSLKKRLENFEHSLANILRNDFTDEEILTVFSLYNHGLLGENTANGSLEINDHDKFKAKIKGILQRINNNIYSDESVTVNLKDEYKPELKEYTEVEGIEDLISIKQGEIEKDEKIVQTAGEKEDYLNRAGELREKLKKKNSRFLQYQNFKEEEGALETKRSESVSLQKDKQQVIIEQQKTSKRISDLERMSKIVSEKIKDILNRESRIFSEIQSLIRPDQDWVVPPGHELIEEDMELLIENHMAYVEEERKLSSIIARNLDYIESQTYGKYTAETEEEILEKLKRELDELEQQEKAVSKLWNNVMTALNTNMRDMLEDIKTLKSKVSNLNRSLSKVQISDLASLKIVVEEKKSLTELMKGIVKRSTVSDLFALSEIDKSTEPIEELQKRFMDKGKIEISDLFTLKFEIRKADDTTEMHTSLKNVESNGTTITIKVLVNLMLMKGLFDPKKDIKIPFYLDEVGSLDTNNATAITRQAEELGFTPIIASPEPMHIVNKVYFLHEGKKRGLYVDERNTTYIEAI